MPSKIYCKNRHIVAADPVSSAHETVLVTHLGREISVQRGASTAGGVLLPREETLSCSRSCHEVIVKASGVRGVEPGDRVVVYLGGDTAGEVNANGISAFVKIDGSENFVIAEAFIWAKVSPLDGSVRPLRNIALTERNDAAFRKYTLGGASVLFMPDAQVEHGMRATGDASDQVLAAVTALYETVVAVGPDADLAVGDVVCFSPSYSATRLRSGGRQLHLIASDEAYFVISD